MREFLADSESQSGLPKFLFHGTSSASLDAILASGLRPRRLLPGKTAQFGWRTGAPPSADHLIYLAADDAQNAVRFAARDAAAHDKGATAVVLRVDTRGMDLTLLAPDEDSRADTWQESLDRTGTVAYAGVIPAESISLYERLAPEGWVTASVQASPDYTGGPQVEVRHCGNTFYGYADSLDGLQKLDIEPMTVRAGYRASVSASTLNEFISTFIQAGAEYVEELTEDLDHDPQFAEDLRRHSAVQLKTFLDVFKRTAELKNGRLVVYRALRVPDVDKFELRAEKFGRSWSYCRKGARPYHSRGGHDVLIVGTVALCDIDPKRTLYLSGRAQHGGQIQEYDYEYEIAVKANGEVAVSDVFELESGGSVYRQDRDVKRRLPIGPAVVRAAVHADLDDDLPSPEDLDSIRAVRQLAPQLAAASQTVYDAWQQDDEGYDDELGSGGICDGIAEAMQDCLSQHGVGVEVVQFFDQYQHHRYLHVLAKEGVFELDIPHQCYETGGGYNWKKKPDVVLDQHDVWIARVDDFQNWPQYRDAEM